MYANLFLALLSAAALASPVFAQSRPAERPAPVQPRPGQGTQNIRFPTTLHQMNDVNKSLNLNPEQINRLNKVTEETQARHRENYAAMNNLKDSERIARQRELNQKYYADWHKAARDVFNDEQWKRYQQYYYQYGGFNAFYEPEIQTQLALTADQIASLNDQATWSDQQLLAIEQTGETDPVKAKELYNQYWKQRNERMGKFLTVEQQKKWQSLTGEPYTFQPAFAGARK